MDSKVDVTVSMIAPEIDFISSLLEVFGLISRMSESPITKDGKVCVVLGRILSWVLILRF